MLRRHLFPTLGAFFLPPAGAAPRALEEAHFPTRLHQFVWRNWELGDLDRMARVARAAPDELLALGGSMGLPEKPRPAASLERRTAITTIRQNWHLLPEEQLIELLGWERDRYAFTLKEDDFLDVKLGPKPECAAVRWARPDLATARRADDMRKVLEHEFGASLRAPGEVPLAFIDRLSAPVAGGQPAGGPPRIVYSYFALYGDPLTEPDLDPFPDGYLDRLAGVGVNGVWMQCVLRTMAPARSFPEFGAGAETRLSNLARLAARLRKRGVKLYLYLNEPRSMPAAFFASRPQIRGAASQEWYAMCTAVPEVREWIADATMRVFRAAPELGGVFTITMSENFTNCFSKFRPQSCPRCATRKSWDGVGEVIESIHRGVRAISRDADVIVWDWGWPDDLSENLIPKLPRDCRYMSVSEWDTPVERGGVKSKVGEYSISVPGPGPRATANWKRARAASVPVMAKTQFNNTWEMSAVPWLPVPYLVAEHCSRLKRAGVEGMLASWTLGGYPSPNLEVAREIASGVEDPRAAVERVARRRYGDSALAVTQAWQRFSDAFVEFPYGVAIYTIPTQHGPANLLRLKPTGVRSSMILFPQDDYRNWCGPYPPEVAHKQFAKLAALWETGLHFLPEGEDRAIAETCHLHFRSVANQIAFYRERDGGRSKSRLRVLVADELKLARRLFTLARRHSVLGYEASNHYYYRPLDLAEKVVQCRWLLEKELSG